ncbi:hypothetical protein BOTBODRAFT_439643 [Botryobasidium botryosum FD-172 SS1]|uniref:Uncharacterized protein n=1 Tax=Botryobasidium botryosum (strain FD-172 SS1) TaxID=930990 RepID=A0A067MUN3_BOTB1|nr:hypothetical protein BOTBODRAFT_439643 [Botryobasidium botryosum FD-172 SS1]
MALISEPRVPSCMLYNVFAPMLAFLSQLPVFIFPFGSWAILFVSLLLRAFSVRIRDSVGNRHTCGPSSTDYLNDIPCLATRAPSAVTPPRLKSLPIPNG